jgi:hypothetical protein
MTKHHPIENLEHALACNSGEMTEAGHKHLMGCAKEVVEWWATRPTSKKEWLMAASLFVRADHCKAAFYKGAMWALTK